jgi:hypothetical protein
MSGIVTDGLGGISFGAGQPSPQGIPSQRGSLLTSIRTMFVGPIMGKFLDCSHRIYRYS